MKDRVFCPDDKIQQEILYFCFMPVLQAEMNIFVKAWNSRYVRQSSLAPGGRPDLLFQFPHEHGFVKQGQSVTKRDIDAARDV